MTGPELAQALDVLFGPQWRTKAAEALGVSRETLWRHARGIPGPDVVAVVEEWGRLAGFGLAPPAFPDGVFHGLPELAACQNPLTADGLPDIATALYGERWRDALGLRYGLTRSGLWRQVSSGTLSGPLTAGVRAAFVVHALSSPGPAEGSRPRAKVRRKPKYAALLTD